MWCGAVRWRVVSGGAVRSFCAESRAYYPTEATFAYMVLLTSNPDQRVILNGAVSMKSDRIGCRDVRQVRYGNPCA